MPMPLRLLSSSFSWGRSGSPLAGTAALAAAMLSFCIPASRLVARLVEKKAHTFTVGGAVFVGVLMAPWIVVVLNRTMGVEWGFYVSPAAALAAFAIAYAFGEGLGRLACVSFGCCYGRPLNDAPPWLARLFAKHSFSFYGKTRKIAYAGGLEGERVLPVQALTAIIHVGCGLCSIVLFLHCRFVEAFVVTMAVTQGWRVLSELLRADYRGAGKVSAYQVMGVIGILYGCAAIILAPATSLSRPDLSGGIATLWQPGISDLHTGALARHLLLHRKEHGHRCHPLLPYPSGKSMTLSGPLFREKFFRIVNCSSRKMMI